MTRRSSESRRRRLLQRGMMGETVQQDVDDTTDSETDDETAQPSGPADIAVRSLLGLRSQASAQPTGTAPAKSTRPEPVPRTAAPQIQTKPNHTGPNQASRMQSDAGLATIQSLLADKHPLTWVFTGDNTIQGAFYTAGQRSCVEIFSERLRAELRRSMDVVINSGISGDTVPYALSTLRWRALRFKPDIVVVSLGLNDAKAGVPGLEQFTEQMQELLDEIRTQGAIPLLILPHPICVSAISNREALPHYVEALKAVAVRDEVPCVDHWSDWQKHWPSQSATRKRLHEGRMHLNAESHRHLATLLFETLGIFDPQSATCKQN
jgi:lysophospholipase L1-like esterase